MNQEQFEELPKFQVGDTVEIIGKRCSIEIVKVFEKSRQYLCVHDKLHKEEDLKYPTNTFLEYSSVWDYSVGYFYTPQKEYKIQSFDTKIEALDCYIKCLKSRLRSNVELSFEIN